MDQNGGKYSKGAQEYSEGLRGFFGARGMGVDAVDFAEKKGGKTVLTGKIAIAADGKSRTVTIWSMKGKKRVKNVAVYDKA